MYPEYRKQLIGVYTLPTQCTRYCCGWTFPAAPGVRCIAGGRGIINEL